jgi:hypothetical protein
LARARKVRRLDLRARDASAIELGALIIAPADQPSAMPRSIIV